MTQFRNQNICDWLSVSQVHDIELTQPSKTHYLLVDTESGEVQEKKHNAYNHEGSFSTNIRIQVNGGRVSLSGNVGRFERPDNVFGLSLDEVKHRTNDILAPLGLPPFSAGVFNRLQSKSGESISYTGAKISRVDLCTNFSAGSSCSKVIDYLSSKHVSRTKSRTFGDSETIQWGTTLKTTKIYTKSAELRRHNKNKLSYIRDLAQWCEEVGLLRHETKFNERYLNRYGLKPWCKCTQNNLLPHYLKTQEIMNNAIEIKETVDLPSHVLGTYHAYTNGMDMSRLSRATFYRHRKILLDYGIDISVKNNVKQLPQRIQLINLNIPSIPYFYNKVA